MVAQRRELPADLKELSQLCWLNLAAVLDSDHQADGLSAPKRDQHQLAPDGHLLSLGRYPQVIEGGVQWRVKNHR
jgi:hypothetical protein